MKKLPIKEEIKMLATKTKVKAGKDKIVKIRTFDLNYFCGIKSF